MTVKLKPLPHQKTILEQLSKTKKAMVVIPSGAGKTHTIAFDVISKNPRSFLYVVHRNEILMQTVKVFEDLGISKRQIGIINKHNKEFDKPYLFGTIQTLDKNLDRLPKNIDYIVTDEHHHTAAPSYQRLLQHVKPKFFYGLTATPQRMDMQDISKQVDNIIVGNIDILAGIQKKILVPFHYIGLRDNIDYSDIQWNGYKYNDMDLDKKLLVSERDQKVIKEYKDRILSENRLTIGFCNSVNHIKRMVEKFTEAGIRAVGIYHTQPIDLRQKILIDFRRGKYDVLFTRDILNEGVDFPECDALLFLRPTYSKTIFLQQLGRGLRKREGKQNVTVLDFIGNDKRADKMQGWLREIQPRHNLTGEYVKPELLLSAPYVEFDQEVIDHIALLESLEFKTYTDEELKQNYFEVKEKLGRQPSANEMRKPLSKTSVKPYQNHFGSWNKFLKEIGEPLMLNIGCAKDELIENYFEVKKKLGRPPNQREMKKPLSRIHNISYTSHFGTWNKFLKEIGEPLKHERHKRYTKDEFIKNYFDVKKKLGRQPYSTEMKKPLSKISKATYNNHFGHFGTWNKFLKEIGEMPSEKKCKKCGNPFPPLRNNHLFCSQKCREKYNYHTHKQKT